MLSLTYVSQIELRCVLSLFSLMIRVCRADAIGFSSISIDADGIVSNNRISMPIASNAYAISSNMGEPCWYLMGSRYGHAHIYKWQSHKELCGKIKFRDDVIRNINYAAIVNVAFAVRPRHDNVFITSRCKLHIWNGKHPVRSIDPTAIVDSTGTRLYVDENVDNNRNIRPIGEQVPFGWWLPHVINCNTKMYAACGNIVASTGVFITDRMRVWDVRVGEVICDQLPDESHNARYSRCAFINEHLLTLCFDHNSTAHGIKGDINTTLFDLRNMDKYDLGSIINKFTLFGSTVFCAPTRTARISCADTLLACVDYI